MLLNDSIGTFAGGRYLDPDIMIGIILGTGTNMAYLERKAVIHNAPHKLPAGYSDEMLINSEWGCYDSPLLPVCPPMCRTWAFAWLLSGQYQARKFRIVLRLPRCPHPRMGPRCHLVQLASCNDERASTHAARAYCFYLVVCVCGHCNRAVKPCSAASVGV